MRICLLFALAAGLLGLALRLLLPVIPADASFREVVRYYGADRPPGESGNMRETSAPY
ncbi:hypothetical protein BHAOGJBA_3518 [Methylobacterium hispanicum]|jgi:hypothetical protein|uniref:Uncharacterized protein n=1 Tax=Methylobacterium hispanicum TaxID=270350 RepID=A0AAV4ZPY6_9HYPH|nr:MULTISPECIES: hypothetical protein [Methylobacterium]GJD89984.1 hypothetical protein BHAOGJBA_3518 [Methylobacterium hispanicum]